MPETETFIQRLSRVLGDRKLTPWCEQFGVSKSRAHRIGKKGLYPEPEELGAMSRAEGVNLNWLIEGRGPPFHVNKASAPRDATDLTEAFLEDEHWTAYLLLSADGEDQAVALTLPAEIELGGERIPYTAVEMIAGNPFMDWEPVIVGAAGGAYRVTVEPEVLERLRQGELSPYELVGADGRGGILANSMLARIPDAVPDGPRFSRRPATAVEEAGGYGYDSDAAADLESAYRRLAEQNPGTARRKLLELLDRSLQDLENRTPE